jgi:hypothetical protein
MADHSHADRGEEALAEAHHEPDRADSAQQRQRNETWWRASYREVLAQQVGDSGLSRSAHGGHGHSGLGSGRQQRGGECLTAGVVDGRPVGIKFGVFDVRALPPPHEREPEHHVRGGAGEQPPWRVPTTRMGGFVRQDGVDLVGIQLGCRGGEVHGRAE